MSRFAFADFVLDLASGDLRRGPETIDLRPKLHALLTYLVENRGRLLSKDELMRNVWPEVHVADQTLNRAMSELRDILGDNASEPQIIETIPRRGYRFVAEVRSPAGGNARIPSTFALMHRDRSLNLFEGENILGRTPDCDVQLASSSVSRRHARIVIDPDGATIEDLGSTNGTMLDERRVTEPTRLSPGDPIKLGRESVRFIAVNMTGPTDRIGD